MGSGEGASQPVLVSACLLGYACRYDGASVPCTAVIEFAREHRVVPVCPEQLGGLPTPRTPCEIQPDGRIVDRTGVDRSLNFQKGAEEALRIARDNGCTQAILKANSPSCGPHRVYDGTFGGLLVAGRGIAAAVLEDAGISVQDEDDMR